MDNTVLESTGLGSTQKRIRYCVSGTYICDGIEHINVTLPDIQRKTKWLTKNLFQIFNKFIVFTV